MTSRKQKKFDIVERPCSFHILNITTRMWRFKIINKDCSVEYRRLQSISLVDNTKKII